MLIIFKQSSELIAILVADPVRWQLSSGKSLIPLTGRLCKLGSISVPQARGLQIFRAWTRAFLSHKNVRYRENSQPRTRMKNQKLENFCQWKSWKKKFGSIKRSCFNFDLCSLNSSPSFLLLLFFF